MIIRLIDIILIIQNRIISKIPYNLIMNNKNTFKLKLVIIHKIGKFKTLLIVQSTIN